MPSNQTANYQLSQWVKSDQVKMDDFNADNAKLDAALGSLEARVGMKQIYTTTTTEDLRDCIFNLPEIDWTKWKRVIIDIKAPMQGSGIYMNICWTHHYANDFTTFDPYWTELMLFPEGDPDRHVTMIYWANTGGFLRLHNPYSSFKTISIHAINGHTEERVLAGTTFTIWGEPM